MSDASPQPIPTLAEREAAFKTWYEKMVQEGVRLYGFAPSAVLVYEGLNGQKGLVAAMTSPVEIAGWQPPVAED